MFGSRFFGRRYFGPRYFGRASSAVEAEETAAQGYRIIGRYQSPDEPNEVHRGGVMIVGGGFLEVEGTKVSEGVTMAELSLFF